MVKKEWTLCSWIVSIVASPSRLFLIDLFLISFLVIPSHHDGCPIHHECFSLSYGWRLQTTCFCEHHTKILFQECNWHGTVVPLPFFVVFCCVNCGLWHICSAVGFLGLYLSITDCLLVIACLSGWLIVILLALLFCQTQTTTTVIFSRCVYTLCVVKTSSISVISISFSGNSYAFDSELHICPDVLIFAFDFLKQYPMQKVTYNILAV